MIKQSEKIERNQKIYYYSALFVAAIIIGVIAYMMMDEKPEAKKVVNTKIDVPTDTINPQEIMNNRLEGELELVQNRFKMLESFVLDAKEKEEMLQKENIELRSKIDKLSKSLKNNKNTALESLEKKLKDDNVSQPFSFSDSPVSFTSVEHCEPRRGLVVKISEQKKDMVKHVDTTIPAGTTVKAVMVSSVDAPCGSYSSSDPQPVILQILDDGHLPKKVRARLKGGVVVASAYGDLSSERLYIRVERLTQMKPSGDFVETDITGFITGEDGKYGVRGVVVDRSNKLIGNAAMSGVVSGVNSFFQAYASSRWGCYGCGPAYGCFEECSNKDLAYGLASQGGTSGMENAFNTLTDYYIRRAELIKPVLQVNAGRIVDLTFSISTDIGDIHTRDKTEKIRKNSREKCKKFS